MKRTLLSWLFIVTLAITVFTIPAFADVFSSVNIAFEEKDMGVGFPSYAEPYCQTSGVEIISVDYSAEYDDWKAGRDVIMLIELKSTLSDRTFGSTTAVRINNNHASLKSSSKSGDTMTLKVAYKPVMKFESIENIWFDSDYIVKWDPVTDCSRYEVLLSIEQNDTTKTKTLTVGTNKVDVSYYAVGASVGVKVRAVPTDTQKLTHTASDWTELGEKAEPSNYNTANGFFSGSGSSMVYSLYSGGTASGWQMINGNWYYMDPNNRNKVTVSSWKDINGKRYHFNENGIMQTGWITDIDGNQYFLSRDAATIGIMQTGWIENNPGKWYWCNTGALNTIPVGALLVNSTTPDGYPVGANGLWQGQATGPNTSGSAVNSASSLSANTGWNGATGSWKYLINGIPVTGWKMINNKWYYFNPSGIMQTGWYTDTDGHKYILNPSVGSEEGTMLTGWKKTASEQWYFFNDGKMPGYPFGALVRNAVTPDGYTVDTNGAWVH